MSETRTVGGGGGGLGMNRRAAIKLNVMFIVRDILSILKFVACCSPFWGIVVVIIITKRTSRP